VPLNNLGKVMPYSMFRNPTAAIPLGMSAAAFIIVLVHVITTGTGTPAPSDEGTAAHLFQLLLAGQAPFVAFFAVKWLPRMPAEAMLVIAAQAAAALLALAPVAIFDL
jgi:hypothetical protein